MDKIEKKTEKELLYEVKNLRAQIEKLKQRKKYGLVWDAEREPEKVVLDCRKKLPILVEDKKKEIKGKDDGPVNLLIEGDNYHSLSVLNYTHKGKIDLIYIDPPYNTGAKNWKYNNNYVDNEDAYRHSKWLNFMKKRLDIARKLLKSNGVLICAIDENELWRLGCLLDDIFSDREIHLITVVQNPKGVQGKNFSYVNEFAFFVLPKGEKTVGDRKLADDEIYWSNLRNWGNESLRTDAKNCFYPIIIKDEEIIGFGDVADNKYHPKKQTEEKKDKYFVWPIDTKGIERKWRYARQSVESIKDFLKVRKRKERFEIEIGKDFGTVKTIFQGPKYDASEYGTKMVNALVPKARFDFPKSLYTVFDCLFPIISKKKDSIVLDFFAGSGTTGHATMLLNKLDGGKRKFILCTNNENGIAEDICYERIKSVGKSNKKYSDVTGIKTNLRYYKTGFVETENLDNATDQDKIELTYKAGEMIAIREETFEEIEKDAWWQIFSNGNEVTAIYFKEDKTKLQKLVEKLDKMNKKINLYIFSWGKNEYANEFPEYRNIKVKDIPEPLIDVYKEVANL